MRHRDIHVLTVNTYTYTSDQRFQTAHHKDTDEWTLQIKYVQERDKGSYECQVSTQPVKSYIVSLNVVGEYCRHSMTLPKNNMDIWRKAKEAAELFMPSVIILFIPPISAEYNNSPNITRPSNSSTFTPTDPQSPPSLSSTTDPLLRRQ